MIVRVEHRKNYTTVDNTPINDSDLSFRALGVLVYLLSKPDGWEANYRHLATVRHEGESSVRSALRELQRAGYLEHRRQQGTAGQFEWVHVIHEVPNPQVEPCGDSPCVDKPCGGEPVDGAPRVGESRRVSTEVASTRSSKETMSTAVAVRSRDAVERVFDAWKEATGKPRAQLDPKRRRLIVAALRSHGETDTTDATRGWRNSRFHCGQNDRSQVYNDLELLLRDAKHIEQFRDLERNGSAPLAVSRNTMTAAQWAEATS